MLRIKDFQIPIIPLICLVMSMYFAYHLVQGNRGLRRAHQLDKEIQLAEKVALETAEEKRLIAVKVQSLSPASLDLDQLQESARRILNMGAADDRVIFHP